MRLACGVVLPPSVDLLDHIQDLAGSGTARPLELWLRRGKPGLLALARMVIDGGEKWLMQLLTTTTNSWRTQRLRSVDAEGLGNALVSEC